MVLFFPLSFKGTISLSELKHIFPGSKIDDNEWQKIFD